METSQLPRIWLSPPHMSGREQSYVAHAFQQNWIAPVGPHIAAFEQLLHTYLGGEKQIAALSSGTAALHLALKLLGVQEGDEVICQSFTFAASANPILYQRARPVFIDSESQTWNMDPNLLEQALKDRSGAKRPKAIIAVDVYGMPYAAESVAYLSEKYGVPVIEDSAEALGSTYRGRKCGNLGDLAVLSFNGNKIITTSGGGALIAADLAQKQKAVFWATQSRDNAAWYEHSEMGFNYRLSNIAAGIGCGQMEVLNDWVTQRKANHAFYRELFRNIEGIHLQENPSQEYESNFWLNAVLIDSELAGLDWRALQAVLESGNIESRPLWKPLHLQPLFEKFDRYENGLSQDLFRRGLCLPSGSAMGAAEYQRIAEILENALSFSL